jgi:nucleotide-binding universal stress UspA family protein
MTADKSGWGVVHVVAAIDSSSAAQPVVRAARTMADVLGARVTAVHVREPGDPSTEASWTVGVPVTMAEGDPVETLLAVFADPEVIGVIGARDRRDDARPAGGVAANVIERVTNPIVVVGPTTRPPRHGRMARVLFPLDGTAGSATAVEPVAAVLGQAGVDVVVQHVFDRRTVPAFWDQGHHEAESWSREFRARWCGEPVTNVTWTGGVAADEIVASGAAGDVDMIVLSWAQNASPGHAAIVKSVLANAQVPVLLVKERDPVGMEPADVVTKDRATAAGREQS